jgi:tetratricopeptide (TPR) repeat protein
MSILIAATNLDAEQAGRIIGSLILPLLTLLGFIKCLTLLRRSAVNKVGIASLAVILLGLFVVAVLSALGASLPEFKETAMAWAPFVMLFLSILAILLAIVGLATHERNIHRQGQAQAIGSIIMSFLCMSGSLVGVLKSLITQQITQATLLVNVDRPAWGYRTALSTMDWLVWKEPGNALADFGALRDKEAVMIIPVDFGQPVPDTEAAAAALLKRLNIPYPSDDGWVTKPWPCAWGEGLEITGSRSSNGGEDYEYILRVAVKDRFAQLHAGWAAKKAGNLALVRTALDAITLLPPQSPPPVLPPAQLEDYGLACNDLAIALYSRNQFKEAAPWFKRSFEQTLKDPAILGNVADALRQAGESTAALEYLVSHMSAFPKQASLYLHHAWLLSDSGDDTGASQAFIKAVETGLKDENKALEWFQHLNGKEQHALATQAAEKWMTSHPGVNSSRWHAQTVTNGGDARRGLQLLENLSSEFPDDRRVLYDFGEALNDLDEHARAAVVAEKLLEDGKESARALMILGWSQMGRKWYREAKETFERADKKQPDNDTVQDALRRASAMLGQGNNSDIKTSVEIVALPEILRHALDAHPMEKDYGADQPYVLLFAAKGYSFEAGKPLRRTSHRRFHINTTEGANDLSSIEYTFDPLSERIFINRVEVRDENGKAIATRPRDAYVMDSSNDGASHRKKLHFQLPGLRPGCTVEYEVSIQEFGNTESFPFERHLFGDAAAEIVFITGDIDKVKSAVTRADTLQTVREKNLIAWMGFNLPYDHDEPLNGSYEDRVPSVCICGEEGAWEKIGEDYLKDIKDRLKPDAKTAELAARLTAGMKADREKITALAGHVQKHISYTAIEFGTRARRPNPASQTLQQQYGDCKDQALLMHQLLQAASIESHLALVNSTWRIQPSLPSMDQFNHMIVHVPGLGADWLIDTTDKNLPPALWHADSLWHTHALILQPGHVHLNAPFSEPASDSSRVESRREVRPVEDGWHVEETLTLHGYYASWMRNVFNGMDAAGQLHKVQSMLGALARVRVHEFAFANLGDIAQPAALTLSYDVLGRLHDEGDLQRAALPALWENDYLVTTFVKNRHNPFQVRYPFRLHSEVVIQHVPGVTPTSLQALNRSSEGAFSHWKLASAQKQSDIVVSFEFDSTPGQHPAASYSKWHDEWNSALKAWDHPLVWKP